MNEDKFSRTSFNSEDTSIPKRKKSYSLLSALVRRTKGKKKKQDGSDLNYVCSSSTFESNFSDKKEEIKSKNSVNSTDSEPSLETIGKTKNKFFSKFLVKHNSSEIEKRNLENVGGDDAQNENKENIPSDDQKLVFPISFIKFDKPNLPSSLIEGIIFLQNLSSRLEQSEKYLMNVVKEYDSDVTIKKELVDTICAHSNLRLSTERMTHHLSLEMWSKQLEVEKGQQNTLQHALGSVIKQNRQLLHEYEDLFLTYEKLLSKFKSLTVNRDLYRKECGQDVQEVVKRNEDLVNKIEQNKNELVNSRKQNEDLEERLTKVSGQFHDLEAVLKQTKADYERRLQSKEKVILDIQNACNLFVQDMESNKSEINWSKFKSSDEENLKQIIDLGRLCVKNLIKEVKSLKNEVNNKEKVIDGLVFTNEKLQENLGEKILSEDKKLFLDHMKVLFNENCLHEPIFTTEQFNQVLVDKQNLLKQQEILVQDCQMQQNEIACISNNNKVLLQKFEVEHKTLISLQTERKNYLEERALFKVIFGRMKSELARLQKLENTVADVSSEANKLAIVAEYNKELGKKLKTELEEKDKIIVKLRNTVENLNDIQLKNTKEKISLCFELSELSQLKEKLDDRLTNVVKKNEALDEAKQCTNIQLEKIDQVQKKERSAFKELVKDLKLATRQRNCLLKEREIAIKKLETMGKLLEDDARKIDQLLLIKEENECRLAIFQKKHEDDDLKICRLQDQLKLNQKTYEDNVRQLEKLIYELRKEKTSMEDTIKYLQNNTQKLHNDLNVSRSNEKELKDAINKYLTEKKCLEEDVIKNEHSIATLSMDKEHLSQELHKLNEFCEKFLADFENNLKNTAGREELFKKELGEKKEMLLRSDIKNEQLIKEILDKKEELARLQDELEVIRTKNIQFHEKIEHLSSIRLNVIELTEKLEQEKSSYAALSEIHKEISSKYIENVKKSVEEKEARLEAEQQLKQVKDQLESMTAEKKEENLANQEEIKLIRTEMEKLEKVSQDNQSLIFSLRQDAAKYQQQLIGLEFQKSEVTLRFHELQRKYEAQVNICEELQNIQKVILNTIYKLRENELVDQEQYNCLISLVRNNALSDVEAQNS